MAKFFTADTHFSHPNILRFEAAARRFSNVTEMDESLVARWNALVGAADTVFHLGDVALGRPIDVGLACVGKLNGTKVLIEGNHDRPWMARHKLQTKLDSGRLSASDAEHLEFEAARWRQRYIDAGFSDVIAGSTEVIIGGQRLRLSHFPYPSSGDTHHDDRFAAYRPLDDGVPLIHGHVHSSWRYRESNRCTPMVNVGVDVWNLTPVPAATVLELLTDASAAQNKSISYENQNDSCLRRSDIDD